MKLIKQLVCCVIFGAILGIIFYWIGIASACSTWYVGQPVWTVNAGAGKVISVNDLEDLPYLIRVKCGNGISTYTKDGLRFNTDTVPALYAEEMEIVPVKPRDYFDLGDHVGFNADAIKSIGSDESFCGKIVEKIIGSYGNNKQYVIESCKDKDLKTIDIVCLRKLKGCKQNKHVQYNLVYFAGTCTPTVKWYASPKFYIPDKTQPDLFYEGQCFVSDVTIGLRDDGIVVWKKREEENKP